MNPLIKIAWAILSKFMTEKFVSRIIVVALRGISKSTKNTLDDDITNSVAEALGDPCNDCNIIE